MTGRSTCSMSTRSEMNTHSSRPTSATSCCRNITSSTSSRSAFSCLRRDQNQMACVGFDQRNYSTPGPVSAWMGDCFRTVNYLSAEPGTA